MPRAATICREPGCPAVATQRGHCTDHAREADRKRGTRQQRGYDAAHEQLRRAFAPKVKAGHVKCRRCRELIAPDEPWDLGHPDAECPRPTAPEHRDRCNRAAAGRSSHGANRT